MTINKIKMTFSYQSLPKINQDENRWNCFQF